MEDNSRNMDARAMNFTTYNEGDDKEHTLV
jgi:hypothetical protein